METKFQQQTPRNAQENRPNLTGIPTQMKLDFERRSGLSFDDVRVHYNSSKPAQLRALAYTRGTQVYIGPGHEGSLRHELGHVIQQKSGRVRPTRWIGGLPVNDQPEMERDADRIAVQCMAAPAVWGVIQRDLEETPEQMGSNCGYHALARALRKFVPSGSGATIDKKDLELFLTSHAIEKGFSVIGEAFDPAALAYVGNSFCTLYNIPAKCTVRKFVDADELNDILSTTTGVILFPYFPNLNYIGADYFKPSNNPTSKENAHWSAIDVRPPASPGGGTQYWLYEGNKFGVTGQKGPTQVTHNELFNSNASIKPSFDWDVFLGPSRPVGGINQEKAKVVRNQAAANSRAFNSYNDFYQQAQQVMANIGGITLSPTGVPAFTSPAAVPVPPAAVPLPPLKQDVSLKGALVEVTAGGP